MFVVRHGLVFQRLVVNGVGLALCCESCPISVAGRLAHVSYLLKSQSSEYSNSCVYISTVNTTRVSMPCDVSVEMFVNRHV